MAAKPKPQATEEAIAAWEAVHDDPVLFVESLLGMHLWSLQKEVLRAIAQHERVAVASCHSIGKSLLADCALLWFLYTRAPAVVITTAPTWSQVENVIWRYVAREYGRLPEDLRNIATLLKARIEISPDHYALGLSTDKPDRFQGYHSPHIMLIVDEAAGVDDAIFEAADTLGAGGEYRELLIGNPTAGEGKFYRAFHNEALGYKTLRVDALSTPNFTGEKCPPSLLRQLIQPSQVEQWRVDWGEDSPAYLSRVRAQFPSADELAVIAPLAWFERAQRRTPKPLPSDVVQVGVDVARFGDNRSCIAEAIGSCLVALKSHQGIDTTQLAREAQRTARDLRARTNRLVQVNIDETGVGGGVVDQCKGFNDPGITYAGVNFGAASSDPGRFVNLRAEMYWAVRELLRENNNEPDLTITAEGPEVDRLGSQLASVRYQYTGREKIQVEPKEAMRERKMPSPDEADAVVLAFHRQGQTQQPAQVAAGTMTRRSIIG